MRVDTEPTVRDALPPRIILRLINPILRLVLRTPGSRMIEPLALIEFRGRQSGQRRRVVVGWHLVDDAPVVVTPAPWRVNFSQGHPVTVRWRGRRRDFIGTLETDPAAVSDVINTMLRNGASARSLALTIPAGHAFAPDDAVHTRRSIIRFQQAGTAVRLGDLLDNRG
jgi:hypothetical protein